MLDSKTSTQSGDPYEHLNLHVVARLDDFLGVRSSVLDLDLSNPDVASAQRQPASRIFFGSRRADLAGWRRDEHPAGKSGACSVCGFRTLLALHFVVGLRA
jgi:hypothetical protein